MDWLTPTIFIQILLTVIMGFIGYEIHSMLTMFKTRMEEIKEDMRGFNKILVNHVSDHNIHAKG